jgi:hypothetical protein
MAELITSKRKCGCIHDRRHFLDVIEKEFVEEDLVRVLKGAQIDMELEVIVFSLVRLISAHGLLFECLYIRWKKAVEAKRGALLPGKRCTFVQRLLVEEIHPA